MASVTPQTLLPAAGNPLALLRKLEWRVRNAVESVLGGEYRSAFRGRGMEFDQVVRYEFGDDIRDIDWNVTARLGEPYRKKFVEEREVTLMVLFEDTPSLQFGSGAQSKREALLELAGLVMLLGAVNRDRVGFVHASPGGYILREPVRGRGAIMHAAAELFGQPLPALTGDRGSPAIPWKLLSRAAPRHSIMIWLGDFAPRSAPEGWSIFRKRYQTMGFRVDDPWERELPRDIASAGGSSSGPNTAATAGLVAYDPVSGRLVTLENSAAERAAHARWREARDNAWQALFPDIFSRLQVGTDQNRLDALVRFFHRRMMAR